MVNKIILWLSIIINKRVFFCFFVARVVTCQESVLTFWQHASGILAWPGARCHHVHGQRQRDCYTKKLYEAYFISDIHIKKTKQKTDTSVLAYGDKGSTAFCKSLEPLTLNSQADFSALSFSNLQEYFSRLLGGHSKLLFGCFCLLLWSLSRWSHTSSVMLRLGSRQAMMFIAPRLQVVTVIQVLKTILICLLICCL